MKLLPARRDCRVGDEGIKVVQPTVPPMDTGRPLVLVIDDDEIMREGTVAVLEAEGYEAIGARTGDAALALLRTGTVKPSLILLDFMMPGMTGWQFRAEQMEDAALASIPVIFLSAFHNTLQALQCGPLRAAATLEKPVEAHYLLALVNQLCPPREPSAA
jgi:CheY-like chemotaxis protein